MAIIKEIEGDLIKYFQDKHVNIMVHGCNCFHLMGAGIASKIRYHYPEAYTNDLLTKCGSVNKLGEYSMRTLKTGQRIINLYTQFEPGANFEYSALMKGLKNLEKDFKKEKDAVFGFPEIGCGIGGAQWPYVKSILEKSKLKIIVVHYDQGIPTVGQTKIDFTSQSEG